MRPVDVIHISHLSLTIGDHAILHDVSCQVGQGEVVGLIGPNGSGKTTLLNVLSGFLLPTHGTVRLHGEDITHLSPEARSRKGIARVFQNFGVFREMTVAENILVALEALPKAKRMEMGDVRSNVQKALRLVGLEQHAQKLAGSLSGGQMRLLEITRTLACGQEVFLLDEPTAGVSPKLTQQVADLIMLLKQAGKTVVIVEHDLPFISRICDRVIVMDIGKIVLSGTAAEVRKSPELKELYFGADPTT